MEVESEVPFYTVDAFTDTPFRGNPAAVCLVSRPLGDDAMRAVAAEMNLSETAFVEQVNEEGIRPLRWFTPRTEVPLCGHATLATAHALVREVGVEGGPVRFATASGILTVHRDPDGALRMDFPADPPSDDVPPAGLLEALGCPGGMPSLRAGHLWVIRLPDQDAVRGLAPDFGALGSVEMGEGPLGVAVTAPGDDEDVEFVSRFFAPWVGIDEDPVTGVAHTALTPYWAGELDRPRLRARQLSERGGELEVRLEGERVHLVGRAVTVARGLVRTG